MSWPKALTNDLNIIIIEQLATLFIGFNLQQQSTFKTAFCSLRGWESNLGSIPVTLLSLDQSFIVLKNIARLEKCYSRDT